MPGLRTFLTSPTSSVFWPLSVCSVEGVLYVSFVSQIHSETLFGECPIYCPMPKAQCNWFLFMMVLGAIFVKVHPNNEENISKSLSLLIKLPLFKYTGACNICRKQSFLSYLGGCETEGLFFGYAKPYFNHRTKCLCKKICIQKKINYPPFQAISGHFYLFLAISRYH